MSSSHCLLHAFGRVLAWVTLLFEVRTGLNPATLSIVRVVL
jgi:hypothetical protein